MEIRILGKGMEMTKGIKDWIDRKVKKLDKYVPRIVESHVVIKKEKYFYLVEITVLAKHLRAYGEGRDEDNVYTAIDLACEKLAKQLKKFREKLKNHLVRERLE